MSKCNFSRITAICVAVSAVSISAPAFASNFLTGHGYAASVSAPTVKTYSVELNKTEVVRLPAPASTVIVGNPSIADISIHSPDTIFVIGRSYGETNLTILDHAGQTILDADIQVNNNVPRNGLRVFFGASGRQSYNCSPYCAAAPVLGDSPGFIAANSGGGGTINNPVAFGNSSSGSAGGISGGAGGSSLSGAGGAVTSSSASSASSSAPSSFGS